MLVPLVAGAYKCILALVITVLEATCSYVTGIHAYNLSMKAKLNGHIAVKCGRSTSYNFDQK